MIEPEIIEEKIRASLGQADIQIEDLTGTRDHYKARIVAKAFDGKMLIKRHRMVYAALKEEMKGAIHALTLETYTPEEWAQK